MIKIMRMAIIMSILGISVCLDGGLKRSVVGGCVCACNSSVELKGITLTRHERGSVVRGLRGSMIVVRGCVIGMGKDDGAGAFDLSGSIGVLTNITLKGWGRGGEIYSGRLFGGKGYGGEKGGGEEKGGENGRGREGDGDGEGIEGSISVSESHFSSFCVSSAPFLSSPSIPLISLSHLTFFNISTANEACSSATTTSAQTTCFMSSCSFSSICDVYDGGIVPSLNNPYASLIASNTSFIGCCRTKNVDFTGNAEVPLKLGRYSATENGTNSFIWCEWNGSKTTGTNYDHSDGISSGGAICMSNLFSGKLSVTHCSFNNCYAHYCGGGILCISINSIRIENNSFNASSSQNFAGGGMLAESISSCVRIGGCEFWKCRAFSSGGGLYLNNFQVSESGCIETESGNGESACIFECSFTSCTLSSTGGGGMNCVNVPAAFKMRSLQFISCNATSTGGGLYFYPSQSTAPRNNIYFYFFFFHDCICTNSIPYGHDVLFIDNNNLISSNNPFYESYTTNSDERRIHFQFLNGSNWVYQHTEKKEWLKEVMKDRYVGVSGSDSSSLCGKTESTPCKTAGHAVVSSMSQLSSTITVLGGKHASEGATINVGEKRIIITGRGKETSVIGTRELSSSSTTLFSLTSGKLEVKHLGIDHNSEKDFSPNVFMVSVGSGTLSLDDVVINSSTSGGSTISSSIFVIALSQLRMCNVEIKNLKMNQPLFAEPSSAGSTAGESLLGNVTIRNVNRTTGDGIAMAKSVKGGETFVMWNTTMEWCSCKEGNGGGVYVDVQESGIAIINGTSRFEGCVSDGRAMLGGRGGGMMVYLEGETCKLMIGSQVRFSEDNQNEAMFGKDVFVKCGIGILLETKISRNSFEFFDASTIPLDPRKLCGTENGTEDNIFPLFVYLCETESAVFVDGSRGKGTDYPHCGLLKFACETIEYALMKRGDTPVISVCNQSSLTDNALFERNRVRIEGFNGNQAVINIVALNESANGSLIKLDVDTEFCGIQFILPSRIKGYNAVFESYHKFLLANITVSSLSQAVSFTFATVKAGETMGIQCISS
ncbi:uncharacterized protein MONOS_3976 [Monocercomonoides exilis]|uniref:uncharacterized protein n=1 Tax=Monocercomonoides exilis TaxID=2049356 RepID=UPI00355A8ADA|nr:hypothetical protein MONOS_3976 [Monocercomonoides exilis]|eukprot:MONOS_3976.1-p1 / transcript=MONOS_3976.1 / gene=MONOS_3976 / organism=Monocercomonoides_exilis_PA203 / gene_product=unspecified product / transcript_product=unspecified product / location=Mono_scaffold00099:113885-117273(+) / protein_length=1055 / sequence_SO=supercontig / SO=protein_coding / is_pseudo=false